MTHVSDTHPLVWFLEGSPRLSPLAQAALGDRSARLIVPTIVLAEIRFLHDRGRISIDLPTVLAFVTNTPNCFLRPLDEAVAVRLPPGSDIHDAIIVATAMVYQDDLTETVAVITRNAAITASGLVPVIW